MTRQDLTTEDRRRWHIKVYRFSFSLPPNQPSATTAALIVALLINSFGLGWLFMLLAGGLNSEFGWLEPTGYWPALGLSTGVWGVITLLGHSVHLRE